MLNAGDIGFPVVWSYGLTSLVIAVRLWRGWRRQFWTSFSTLQGESFISEAGEAEEYLAWEYLSIVDNRIMNTKPYFPRREALYSMWEHVKDKLGYAIYGV